MKVIPHLEFNKYDLALGFIIRRENESEKYIRKFPVVNYMFGIMLIWVAIGLEIKVKKHEKSN